MTYVIEQFVVIDKSIDSETEFQTYVMDKRTLREYIIFLKKYNFTRKTQLMLNNRAMYTQWHFENEEEAKEFVERKESYWRGIIASQEHVTFSYGPLQITNATDQLQ